ncbi:peptide chain release factor 3 [Tautonia plasticadhaerens]|uniref:Peptide chain release factor 3 n=1 Tax=Tautonia plasticadhaerens TaxID=2527974 RepID=A0A518GYQ6_9BACT|nr:peptide chain release factor 3 [Tautonia plasticadhaerens]QDV33736.1 Peptide chain release factor 3 [Tautonia plasticadhaerens]
MRLRHDERAIGGDSDGIGATTAGEAVGTRGGWGVDPAVREQVRRRRTFAIISHPDAGKTTLTEKLLLYAGRLDVAGMVRGRKTRRAAASDWMDLERQRGISVTSTSLAIDYRGHRINLLDTPGHQDFSEDTYRTLMAADCAVMVLDAVRGVEAQTEKLFRVCALRKIPILTFVNKMDRPGGDPLKVLGEVEEVLGIGAAPLNWPIGSGRDFRGLCDRRTRRVSIFQDGAPGSLVVPTTDGDRDDPACPLLDAGTRAALLDEIALLDGAGEPFDPGRFLRAEVTPVLFGSALTNYGVEAFLDAFLSLSPPPGPRPSDGGPVPPDRPEFSGFVFKVQGNMDSKHRDRIAFLRVCSGRFVRDMEVVNARTGEKLRMSRSHRLFAQDREAVEEAFPGDIIGLASTGQYRLGDTLYQGEPVRYEPLPQFDPEHFAVLTCRDTRRRKQFARGMEQLVEEGAIQAFSDPAEGGREQILAAVGPLQFEVVQARLESEYGVATDLEPLPYTMAHRVESEPTSLLRMPPGSLLTLDRSGRVVALFQSAFDLDAFRGRNPGVRFGSAG